jgi:hypothetical protein
LQAGIPCSAYATKIIKSRSWEIFT